MKLKNELIFIGSVSFNLGCVIPPLSCIHCDLLVNKSDNSHSDYNNNNYYSSTNPNSLPI